MKTTILKSLFCLLAAVLISCSDDEKPTYYPTGVPVVSKITLREGSTTITYDLTYDAQRRIESMVRKQDGVSVVPYYFEYSTDGYVTKFSATGDNPDNTVYVYGVNGILSSYNNQFDGETTLKYNAVSLEYFAPTLQFSLFENGDIKRRNDRYFHYESGKKGPFANVNGNYHFLGVIGFDNFFDEIMSKNAIKHVSNSGDVIQYIFENTFNAEGYITDADVDNLTKIHYDYIMVY